MTKQKAKCMICGNNFTYPTTSCASVDYDIYGGSICPVCDSRGLGYFISHFRELAKIEIQKETLKLATEINKNKDLEGDWWKKDKPLFKRLNTKIVKLEKEVI